MHTRRTLSILAAAAFVVAACARSEVDDGATPASGRTKDASSSGADADASLVPDGALPRECQTGYADCDGNPLNGCELSTATDPSNCGVCGRRCGAEQVCSAGVCASECGAELKTCGGLCVDLRDDVHRCGDCNNICPEPPAHGAAACVQSACMVQCDAGYVPSGQSCIPAPPSWGPRGYLKASNPGATDRFGAPLALSADGSTLVVGAPLEDSAEGAPSGNPLGDSGAVYIYTRSGSVWSYQTQLKASNAGAGDQFGSAVALSADGNVLVVGAPLEASGTASPTDNSSSAAGAVYVFARTNGAWTSQAYLKAAITGSGDKFGSAVAVSGDGKTVAVGARGESSSASGVGGNAADNSLSGSGAVYVFARGAASWAQQAYLKSSAPDAGDIFGASVALSADGNLLAAGAPGEDSLASGVGGAAANNGASNSGAVYTFLRTGENWAAQTYLKASNTGVDDEFGTALSLSADGTTLAVGAPGENSSGPLQSPVPGDNGTSGSGAAYVYARTASTWALQRYLKPRVVGTNDGFGQSVALAGDGSVLAVGAPGEDSSATGIGGNASDNGRLNSGAVLLFTRTATTWSQDNYLKSSNSDVGDAFGTAVSLGADGRSLACAAPGEDSAAVGTGGDQSDNTLAESGAVYTYAR